MIAKASNQDLVGKKVAFTYGAWCNYVVKDLSHIIVFDDSKVDERLLARAYVNPMTALCVQQRLRDIVTARKGPKALVMFLGADTCLGEIFMNLCARANSQIYDMVPLFKSD